MSFTLLFLVGSALIGDMRLLDFAVVILGVCRRISPVRSRHSRLRCGMTASEWPDLSARTVSTVIFALDGTMRVTPTRPPWKGQMMPMCM